MKIQLTEISISGYEKVVSFNFPQICLRGMIAVHSTKLGPSMGGIRMRPYQNEEEALKDALRLSKAMTYKAAAAGLELGGGKCVIFGNPFKDKTDEMFIELGKVIDELKGLYIAAEDSGTTVQDMNLIKQNTTYVSGTTQKTNPSPSTAKGIFYGIQACVETILEKNSLEGIKIAIQGLGGVGYHLAQLLSTAGAHLIGCDIYAPRVEQAKKAFNIKIVEPDAIFEQKIDLFSPCAYGGVLNEETMAKLRCKIVAGGANNQFANEEKDPQKLHDKGILHAPDYIINAGGLIILFCQYNHLSQEVCDKKLSIIPRRLKEIFAIAKKENKPPFLVANNYVEKRLLN